MGIVIGSCMSEDAPAANTSTSSVLAEAPSNESDADDGPADSGAETAHQVALTNSSARPAAPQFVFVPDLQHNLRDRRMRRLLYGIKCPMCCKFVLPDDIECHLVMCLTKPRLTYNEDVLVEDKGECVICLEDLEKGQLIARLPCLCVYHKNCIDQWFDVNRSCPEHPSD